MIYVAKVNFYITFKAFSSFSFKLFKVILDVGTSV